MSIKYAPGHYRKFLYRGIWCSITREITGHGSWTVRYTRGQTREHHALNGKFLEVSRGHAIRRLRLVIAEELNPGIRKVTQKLVGPKSFLNQFHQNHPEVSEMIAEQAQKENRLRHYFPDRKC